MIVDSTCSECGNEIGEFEFKTYTGDGKKRHSTCIIAATNVSLEISSDVLFELPNGASGEPSLFPTEHIFVDQPELVMTSEPVELSASVPTTIHMHPARVRTGEPVPKPAKRSHKKKSQPDA